MHWLSCWRLAFLHLLTICFDCPVNLTLNIGSQAGLGVLTMFDLPMYLDNLDDGEFTLWVAALLADAERDQ